MRSSVLISERDRFRGAASSSLDVGAGRDLAGGLEVEDEEGDGDDSGGWHGDDGRARSETLTEVETEIESTVAITLGMW